MADVTEYSIDLPTGVRASITNEANGTATITLTGLPVIGTYTWNSGTYVSCFIVGQGVGLTVWAYSEGNPKAYQYATQVAQWGCTAAINYYQDKHTGGGGSAGGGSTSGPNPAETIPKVGGGYWLNPESTTPVDTGHLVMKLAADHQADVSTDSVYGSHVIELSSLDHSVHLVGVPHSVI